MTQDCRRSGCPESFEHQLLYDIHLATDHEPPWEEIEGYPRGPSIRGRER